MPRHRSPPAPAGAGSGWHPVTLSPARAGPAHRNPREAVREAAWHPPSIRLARRSTGVAVWEPRKGRTQEDLVLPLGGGRVAATGPGRGEAGYTPPLNCIKGKRGKLTRYAIGLEANAGASESAPRDPSRRTPAAARVTCRPWSAGSLRTPFRNSRYSHQNQGFDANGLF